VGLGRDFREARDHAYAASARIHFKDMYARTDIGHRALERG
jgi:phosphoribosylamine--glycine ligase